MKFNTKNVTIRDTDFEVRELSIKQLMPIIREMDTNPEEGQMQLLAASVYVDGVALGADFEDLPASLMMQLAPHVMEVNNLDDSEEKS